MLALSLFGAEREVHLLAPDGSTIAVVHLLEWTRQRVRLGFEADVAKVRIMRGSLMPLNEGGPTCPKKTCDAGRTSAPTPGTRRPDDLTAASGTPGGAVRPGDVHARRAENDASIAKVADLSARLADALLARLEVSR